MKLQAVQSALKAPKSQFNKFGGYAYRKAEDILEAVKPLLAEQGCIITCSDDLVKIGERYYVKATATIINTDAGSHDRIEVTAFAREEEEKKGMDGSQISGASSSYARKYALNGLLCIDDTADSDTTNIGEEKQPASKKNAPAKKSAPAAEQPKPEAKQIDKETYFNIVRAYAEGKTTKSGKSLRDYWIENVHPTPEMIAEFDNYVEDYKATLK